MTGRFGVAAACALVACIPSAGLALGAFDGGLALPMVRGAAAQFTPSSVDPRMAALVARAARGDAHLMRFTPAGVPDRAGRSVTVAVRIDEQAARAISIHSAIAEAKDAAAGGTAPELRLAPMPYNLGLARGYQSFAKIAVAPAAPVAAVPHSLADAGIPDLSYKVSPAGREPASRFTPRNTASEPRAAAAPRALESRDPSDQALDVAGSYRLTRNFDVTAGVRYTQERERLAPVVDTAKQDSQAVYIGTQFHF